MQGHALFLHLCQKFQKTLMLVPGVTMTILRIISPHKVEVKSEGHHPEDEQKLKRKNAQKMVSSVEPETTRFRVDLCCCTTTQLSCFQINAVLCLNEILQCLQHTIRHREDLMPQNICDAYFFREFVFCLTFLLIVVFLYFLILLPESVMSTIWQRTKPHQRWGLSKRKKH